MKGTTNLLWDPFKEGQADGLRTAPTNPVDSTPKTILLFLKLLMLSVAHNQPFACASVAVGTLGASTMHKHNALLISQNLWYFIDECVFTPGYSNITSQPSRSWRLPFLHFIVCYQVRHCPIPSVATTWAIDHASKSPNALVTISKISKDYHKTLRCILIKLLCIYY